MKTTEMYVAEGEAGFKVEHKPNYPVNPLTAEQKFYLLLALILTTALIVALYLVGTAAFFGAGGLFLMFGVYQALSNA